MSVLVNENYKSYDSLSRYQTFPFWYNTLDNKYIMGVTAQLKDDTLYSIHVAVKGDTWDSLSLHYYGNPTWYWIICDFNRVQDPFTEIKEGEHIKIPSFSNIQFE